jgi:hypothetical protein
MKKTVTLPSFGFSARLYAFAGYFFITGPVAGLIPGPEALGAMFLPLARTLFPDPIMLLMWVGGLGMVVIHSAPY